jgi:hypothetical protein
LTVSAAVRARMSHEGEVGREELMFLASLFVLERSVKARETREIPGKF